MGLLQSHGNFSLFHLPVGRLAAAHAALEEEVVKEAKKKKLLRNCARQSAAEE